MLVPIPLAQAGFLLVYMSTAPKAKYVSCVHACVVLTIKGLDVVTDNSADSHPTTDCRRETDHWLPSPIITGLKAIITGYLNYRLSEPYLTEWPLGCVVSLRYR